MRFVVSRFNQAGSFFCHGCDDVYDEAVYLVLHSLNLPLDRLELFFDACLTDRERAELDEYYRASRVEQRVPAAYLTHEAWPGDYKFYVDERVIVPRSFIAELLFQQLQPWVALPEQAGRVLDLYRSGCLAILAARSICQCRGGCGGSVR